MVLCNTMLQPSTVYTLMRAVDVYVLPCQKDVLSCQSYDMLHPIHPRNHIPGMRFINSQKNPLTLIEHLLATRMTKIITAIIDTRMQYSCVCVCMCVCVCVLREQHCYIVILL